MNINNMAEIEKKREFPALGHLVARELNIRLQHLILFHSYTVFSCVKRIVQFCKLVRLSDRASP